MYIYLLLIIILPILSITLNDLIPDVTSISVAEYNSEIIEYAFYNNYEVIIPNKTYTIYPVYVNNISDIYFQIDGTLVAQTNIKKWPTAKSGRSLHMFDFEYVNNITITGNGLVDGKGYKWWKSVLLGYPDTRGHMFKFSVCKDILIENIHVKNSPMYHFDLMDIENLIVRYVDIWVDTTKQKELYKKNNMWDILNNMPLYPLNTDGIDPKGKNVHIYNMTVRNYDDVVAVKPANSGDYYTDCTENILVENIDVTYSTGMAIGTVPPHNQTNCIKDVIFRNINFKLPFKAIYIKTNPGDNGLGLIENIIYDNITIDRPLWYSIYIGPQQQKQPDGSGPGCMFYPLNPDCPTEPRVSIKDIILKDVKSDNGLLLPGIIRCNETNPCDNFMFDNVNVSGWMSNKGYICENINGISYDSYPIPCF